MMKSTSFSVMGELKCEGEGSGMEEKSMGEIRSIYEEGNRARNFHWRTWERNLKLRIR